MFNNVYMMSDGIYLMPSDKRLACSSPLLTVPAAILRFYDYIIIIFLF